MTVVTSLQRWLNWTQSPDCPCRYEWRSLGILHDVSMGKGWVRMTADLECRHHSVTARERQ